MSIQHHAPSLSPKDQELLEALQCVRRSVSGPRPVHVVLRVWGVLIAALYGLNLLEADYFRRAMASISQAYTNTTTTVIFVIVTDDMDWAETNLMFPDMKVDFTNET